MATLWAEYEKLSKLGEGAFAKVYLVREKATGDLFAVKKTKLSEAEGVQFSTLREMAQLKALNDSPYVVRMCGSRIAYGSVSQKPTLYLLLEALDCDLTDLYVTHYDNKPIPKKLIKSLAYQLLKGLAFIHSRGVIHRDMKTVNILVDLKNKRLKIADFGIARYCTIPCMQWTPKVVTPWYRAPEIILGARIYSPASDVWSVGMIIAEVVNKDPLIEETGDRELLQVMFGLLGVPDEKSWPGVTNLPQWKRIAPTNVEPPPPFATLFPTAEPLLVDLLSKLLTYDPAQRISAKKALDHPYFDKLDKNRY